MKKETFFNNKLIKSKNIGKYLNKITIIYPLKDSFNF